MLLCINHRKVNIKSEDVLRDCSGRGLCLKLKKVDFNMLKVFNSTLSSIRIIVENYFGRLNVLFKMTKQSFVYNASSYAYINKVATALTNCHIFFYPLRKFPYYYFHLNPNEEDSKKKQLSDRTCTMIRELGSTFCNKSIHPSQTPIEELREKHNDINSFHPASISSTPNEKKKQFVLF